MRADPVRNLAARAVGIGADPADSRYVRERKELLVGVSLMVLPAGVVWGALYGWFD